MSAKKPNLPRWLQRTEAEVAEEQKTQAERQAGFTRAKLTEGERLIQRGVLLEETARGNIAAGAGDDALAQLAEGLALQGRYEEAAMRHPDEAMRTEYQRISQAIEMDDSEKCACLDDETEGLTITPRYSERMVFSTKHGAAVSLITCRKCGHSNARPARSRLLVQNAAMNTNLATVRGTARLGVSDAQILKKSNAGT